MIKTARLFLVFTIALSSASLSAQQDAQFTQYMFNQLYYNPAYAGMTAAPELTAIHRSQWFGYDGTINPSRAPNTQLISINNPLTSFNGGVGLYILNDNLGPVNNLEIQLSVAYQLKLKNGATLSAWI